MSRLLAVTGLVIGLSFVGLRPVSAAKPVVDPKERGDGAAKIEQALNSLTEVQYLDTLLSDVKADLELRHRIPIQIDSRALADDGKGIDLPITKSLKDLPLASVLNLVLHGQGLEWTVRDEVLLITTPDGAAKHPELKVYSVATLAAQPEFDYDTLIEVVTRMIAPDEWQDNGGPVGQIKAIPAHRSLVISTTYRRHREIRALLVLLTRVGLDPTQAANNAGVPMYARDQIDGALQSKTAMEYLDTPLGDVITNLELLHRLQIKLSAEALAADGPGADVPITFTIQDVSLAAGLNLVLAQEDLDWTVSDGVLLITTKKAVDSGRYSNIRVYPIGDLVDEVEGWDDAAADFAEVVKSIITVEDWVDNGGVLADAMPFTATKSLVVRHSEAGHREIAALLKQLREAQATAARTGGKVERPLITRFYPIVDLAAQYRDRNIHGVTPAPAAEAKTDGKSEKKDDDKTDGRNLALQPLPPPDGRRFVEDANPFISTLMREVRPDSWDTHRTPTGPSIVVDPLTRSLVIRQTAFGHAAVVRFLAKVRADLTVRGGWAIDHSTLPLNVIFLPQTGGGGFY